MEIEVRSRETEQEEIGVESNGRTTVRNGEEGKNERQHRDINLLSVNLFSEMFFGLRAVNWVIMADCQCSSLFIPFIQHVGGNGKVSLSFSWF